MKYYILITNNDWKLWEQISIDMHVSICVSAISAKGGTSGIFSLHLESCESYPYLQKRGSYKYD